MCLRQTKRPPIKFGLRHTEGWAAYVLGDHRFFKGPAAGQPGRRGALDLPAFHRGLQLSLSQRLAQIVIQQASASVKASWSFESAPRTEFVTSLGCTRSNSRMRSAPQRWRISGRSRGLKTSICTKPGCSSTTCGRWRNASLTSAILSLATTNLLRETNGLAALTPTGCPQTNSEPVDPTVSWNGQREAEGGPSLGVKVTSRFDIVARALVSAGTWEYATRRCSAVFNSVIGRCKKCIVIQGIAHICHICHNIVLFQ
jgi:hypothetical protein